MTQRTIEVSGEDRSMVLKHGQIFVFHQRDQVGQLSPEDVGILIVDTPTATMTHSVLTALLRQGAVIVFCGPNHLPVGMALPVEGHHLQTERFRAQVESTQPARKRIWQAVIRAKIGQQAAACEDPVVRTRLERLATEVRSGDPSNREAHAAKVYWGAWLPEQEFRRDPDLPGANALLNYGYAVFRAALARSIIAAGFHPGLGVSHCNRFNAFCLADDLLEPFRPLVDQQVRALLREGILEIDRTAKQRILSLLHRPFQTEIGSGPLVHSLERYLASFHRCLLATEAKLDVPSPLPADSSVTS